MAGGLSDAQKRFVNSEVVKQRACLTCHAVGGTGGTVGPKLDQAGDRRTLEWMRQWLEDPAAIRPGTLMPNFLLSDPEIDELLDLLYQLKGDLNTRAIMAGTGGQVYKGHKLFVGYDCYACHRIGDEGRFIGPDLTWLARRRTPEWERMWLTAPEGVKPGTFMPNFHLPEDERDALVAYVMTLEGQANEASQTWEANTAFQLDSRPREIGERIYKRFGCDGCHGKRGVGGFANPNARPDGQMPRIDGATLIYSEAKMKELLMLSRISEKTDPDGADPLPCPSWEGAITDDELASLYAYLKSIAPKTE